MEKLNLQKDAPILHSISKKTGFEVPNDFFENVENQIEAEIKTDYLRSNIKGRWFSIPQDYFKNIDNIVITKLKASVLNTNSVNGIPKNYFDQVEDKVFSRLKSRKKVISLKTATKVFATLAAAASLLLFVYLYQSNKPVTFESLAFDDIEQYLDYRMDNLEPETIASAFSYENLDNLELDIFVTETDFTDYLSDEDLEYLIIEN